MVDLFDGMAELDIDDFLKVREQRVETLGELIELIQKHPEIGSKVSEKCFVGFRSIHPDSHRSNELRGNVTTEPAVYGEIVFLDEGHKPGTPKEAVRVVFSDEADEFQELENVSGGECAGGSRPSF